MLDQNTDRMWFVIGAVIVGAAIIFIANGTLPTLFASVSDSFEESANKGTEVISEIGPNIGPRKNHLLDAVYPKSSIGPYIDYPIDMATFNELKGQTVTLSFEAKGSVNPQMIDVYFRVINNQVDHVENVFELSDAYITSNEYQRFSHVMVVPDFSAVTEYPLTIRIRRNPASGSNFVHYVDAIENGHVSINDSSMYTIRRVKLELGNQLSDYIPHENEIEEGG